MVSSARAAGAADVLNTPPTKETTLASGLRVASESSGDDTATVGVFINAGSRFETDANNGTAHFLEHMAFKGTSTRSQNALEREIENMGGHLNAYTSREQTVYYAQVLKDDIPKAVDILANILQDSTLDEDAIERERSVILREAEEVAKDTTEVVFDLLHAGAYAGTPLARTILGPEENIRSITKADLQDYIATHYTTENMVVAAAGDVDHDSLCSLAESAFAALPKGPSGSSPAPPHVESKFLGTAMTQADPNVPLAHFALALEGVGWTHPDSFALMVAQTMIGSWDRASGGGKHVASPLAHLVANNDLAHSINSFHTVYSDTALWGVHAVTEPKNLDDLIYVIEQEWVRLSFSVSDKEVERARNQLKTSILMQLDGSAAVAEDIGRQMLTYRRRLTPAEIFARIDAVDADTIKRVANELFYNKSPSIAAVGSLDGMPDYARLESWNWWLRA